MNIRKRGNSYQVRKQYKGVGYSFTFDHKPTSLEIARAFSDIVDDPKLKKGDFEYYANKYIKSKSNVLSPNTVGGYESMLRNMGDLKYKDFNSITAADVQVEINDYSSNHSPKSVRNLHGFISAVLSLYRPKLSLRTTLPQKRKKHPYIPSDEEVRAILKEIKGNEYEVAFWLCALGLRRGEICALTLEDLDDENMLTISKAIAEGNGKIIKYPKTDDSYRVIALPDYVANLIREQGFIYKRHPTKILKHLHKVQDKLGIQPFPAHNFRHYFASSLSSEKIGENDIMRMGGWKTPYVMKEVYRQSMLDKDKEGKKKLSKFIGERLSE